MLTNHSFAQSINSNFALNGPLITEAPNIAQVEGLLGYNFKDSSHLLRAAGGDTTHLLKRYQTLGTALIELALAEVICLSSGPNNRHAIQGQIYKKCAQFHLRLRERGLNLSDENHEAFFGAVIKDGGLETAIGLVERNFSPDLKALKEKRKAGSLMEPAGTLEPMLLKAIESYVSYGFKDPAGVAGAIYNRDDGRYETLGHFAVKLLVSHGITKNAGDARVLDLNSLRGSFIQMGGKGIPERGSDLIAVFSNAAGRQIALTELSGYFKAVLGAVYHESGFEAVRKIVNNSFPRMFTLANEPAGEKKPTLRRIRQDIRSPLRTPAASAGARPIERPKIGGTEISAGQREKIAAPNVPAPPAAKPIDHHAQLILVFASNNKPKPKFEVTKRASGGEKEYHCKLIIKGSVNGLDGITADAASMEEAVQLAAKDAMKRIEQREVWYSEGRKKGAIYLS